MNHAKRLRAFSGLVAALAFGGVARPADAALSSPVTITLSAPGGIVGNTTPVSAVDTVNPAAGITVGDGTHIGSQWMLPNEFIHFSGNSILVDIASGNVNAQNQLITGYLGLGAAHAQYQFTNLAVAGGTIVGINGSFSGITSPATLANFVTLASPNSLNINLDSLILTPVAGGGQSDALGVLTINLLLQAVPEPATWVLLLAGGLGLCGLQRLGVKRF